MPFMPSTNFPLGSWVLWHLDGCSPMVGQVAGILPPGSPVTPQTLLTAGIDPADVDRTFQDPGTDVMRPDEPRYLVLLSNPSPGGKPFLLVPDPLRLSALPGLASRTPEHGTTIDKVLAAPADGKTIQITSSGASTTTRVLVDGEELQRVRRACVEFTPGSTILTVEAYSPRLELHGFIAQITEYDPTAEVEDGPIKINNQPDNG